MSAIEEAFGLIINTEEYRWPLVDESMALTPGRRLTRHRAQRFAKRSTRLTTLYARNAEDGRAQQLARSGAAL